MAAASEGDLLLAFLRSADGHIATCSAYLGATPTVQVQERPAGESTEPTPRDEVWTHTDVSMSMDVGDPGVVRQYAAGRLASAEASRMVLTMTHGSRETVPVVDGYYSRRLASGAAGTNAYATLLCRVVAHTRRSTVLFGRDKSKLPTTDDALPGRETRPFAVGDRHLVLGTPIESEVPAGFGEVVVGLGCFWGEEKTFWEVPGVWSTSVGYAGGATPNPTYEEVCSGRTGHAEVVRVVFDPSVVSFDQLLKTFWENHDPTQGMRQGNDRGTQYRSVIYTTTDHQHAAAEASRDRYQKTLADRGYGDITTAIAPLETYWYAEDYHQQYLAKNPFGYCPLHATGIEYAST